MRFWPASLQSRLMALLFLALLLANTLTLSLLFYERMSSARSVMLGNLASDVATSVAILDRLPAAERPQWLPKLARGNYRYLLDAGERGDYPDSWRARDAARSLQEALSAQYPVSIVAIPGPRQHIQAHITLHDGAPLTLDLWPKLPAIARWLPVVLIAQFVLLLACAWPTARRAAWTPAFALPRRDCILLYLRERRITKPTILPLSRHIRLTWPCCNVVAATLGSDGIMRRRRCRY